MKLLFVLFLAFYITNAYHVVPYASLPYHHFHTQDSFGQYAFSYSSDVNSRHEVRRIDGITEGSYSYVDANGIVQTVNYIADPVFGFRVAATNLPVPVKAEEVKKEDVKKE